MPRSRFAPVKKCSDLLVLRSDAYQECGLDHTMELTSNEQNAPVVNLDKKHYKLLSDFEQSIAAGVPSLRKCTALTVEGTLICCCASAEVVCIGPVHFESNVVFEGTVKVINSGKDRVVMRSGVYNDQVVDVTEEVFNAQPDEL